MQLTANRYGKARVRIMRVRRDGASNSLSELSLTVMLHGDFARAYTDADNQGVIATDTVKNIVNIVAREYLNADSINFCAAVAQRFFDRYSQVARVEITAAETKWDRLIVDGVPQPHGFLLDANGKPTLKLDQTRDSRTLWSGIDGFTFMKSTGSGWADYLIDDYTTLKETQDRIAATSMNATWRWAAEPENYAAANALILSGMLTVFATTYSHGVQDSLFRMGSAALNTVPEIAEITLACPNKHYLPIDLSPFGLSADNMVFTPTDEPHGQIECTIQR